MTIRKWRQKKKRKKPYNITGSGGEVAKIGGHRGRFIEEEQLKRRLQATEEEKQVRERLRMRWRVSARGKQKDLRWRC